MAELFGTKRPAITKHLGNIFKVGELEQSSVCSILEHTASDGKIYHTQFYFIERDCLIIKEIGPYSQSQRNR